MLKFVHILFVSMALACARGAAVFDGRIVGGDDTSIEEHSFQVSLQYWGQHICGASILSEYYVLTAAHCIYDASASSLSIRAGATYYDEGGQVVAVSQIHTHGSYNPSTQDYDIAILVVSASIEVGGPITLPSRPYTNNESAIVTGWGALWTGGPGSLILQEAEVKIITATSCSTKYPGKITARMICAASPGRDSCQGDSGGPLVVDGVQVGVVSWGYYCADPLYPGVYADVYNLRSWIHSVTGL